MKFLERTMAPVTSRTDFDPEADDKPGKLHPIVLLTKCETLFAAYRSSRDWLRLRDYLKSCKDNNNLRKSQKESSGSKVLSDEHRKSKVFLQWDEGLLFCGVIPEKGNRKLLLLWSRPFFLLISEYYDAGALTLCSHRWV